MEGLRDFLADIDPLADPNRIPASLLAAQIGHFLIRGESRQSSRVEVDEHATAATVEDGRFILRATYQRDGHRQPVEVTHDRDGHVEVRWAPIETERTLTPFAGPA